jgi:hypothetical protein
MQLGVFVDGTVDANEEAVRLKIGQMILEIEPRAIPQSGAMRSGGLIEHLGIRFHRDWAARNLSRSEYHQLLDLRGAMHYAPSAPNPKFAHTVRQTRSRTSGSKGALET